MDFLIIIKRLSNDSPFKGRDAKFKYDIEVDTSKVFISFWISLEDVYVHDKSSFFKLGFNEAN